MIRYGRLILAVVLLAATAQGQSGEKAGAINTGMGKGDDAFISRQSDFFLREADAALKANAPTPQPSRERLLALYLLDAVMHDTHAPNRPELQRFYHGRMEEMAAALEKSSVKEGLAVWQLYNHGFIVRSASRTVAFDMHRGPERFRWDGPNGRANVPSPDFPLSAAVIERLARQCDVLFVSHPHADHVDPLVIETFLKQGKPVVAPDEVLKESPLHGQITHLAREAHRKQTLALAEGKSLDVVIYPGQQYQDGGPPNNVALVLFPEGLSAAHNGDEINDPYPAYQEDFQWIDAVHDHFKVDLFLTNCWANDIFRMIRGLAPKLTVLGHHNELGHQMNDREPYWGDEKFLSLNIGEAQAAGNPVLNMAWGESYLYVPAK